MNVLLTNTKTRKKKPFISQVPGKVSLYVCGITPYNYAHVGHARCYVTFDVLVRLLTFIGHEVTYVRNFTDIDDKLLAAAVEQGDIRTYTAIARRFEKSFQEEMALLGCGAPDYEPRVTENMPEIIALISRLIAQGNAYVANGDVYFDVTSLEGYGQLSHRKLEDMVMGARVVVSERKRHPADFALWKASEEGIFWDHPAAGHGRPGWHIECSALAKKFLGVTIDIHGGGADLIFPHHENERAQSVGASGQEFVRYWVHNGLVNVAQEKMSKSLGNFFTLHELFKAYDPMVVRFYLLQHHYRAPIEFTLEGLAAAQKAYLRLIEMFTEVRELPAKPTIDHEVVREMVEALCDDMNTPKFFGILFGNVSKIRNDVHLAAHIKSLVVTILGLSLASLKEEQVHTPEVEQLIAQREEARREKNWARADELRNRLKELGYEVQDKKLKG